MEREGRLTIAKLRTIWGCPALVRTTILIEEPRYAILSIAKSGRGADVGRTTVAFIKETAGTFRSSGVTGEVATS
jgi:hypothetical protein